jgi:hypothetical protein
VGALKAIGCSSQVISWPMKKLISPHRGDLANFKPMKRQAAFVPPADTSLPIFG